MRDRTEKKKLAFVTPKVLLGGDVSPGIQKKVEAQARAFRKLGLRVEMFSSAPYRYGRSEHGKFGVVGDLFSSHAYYTRRFGDISQGIKEFHPDAVYIRYSFSENQFIRFLRRLRKTIEPDVPVFMEIPTYPYGRELRSSGNTGLVFLYFIDLFYRQKLKKYVDRIVTFGDFRDIFGIPATKIGNGVDTDAIRPVDSDLTTESMEEYRFIGVSNLVFWAGFDRMITGLKRYVPSDNTPPVHFDVVGDGPEMSTLRQLAADLGVESAVSFHGSRYGEDLDKLFRGRHLAVGNLAVHRKEMTINPDLKNREYCARGIPFVTSTRDPGFPPDFPFLLPASADESPIEIDSLVRFLDNIRLKHPEHVREMREFSKKNLDWTVMLQPVVDQIKGS